MSDPIHIRAAEKADIAKLYRLEQRCFDAESFSRRQISYLVSRSLGHFLVLTEHEKIAGFIVLLQRRNVGGLRIYSLAIAPEYRGKQYGGRLIAYAVDLAKRQGKTFLYLEVSENNPGAIQLYHKLGFQTTNKRRKYYKDGSDALLMRLIFNSPDEVKVS